MNYLQQLLKGHGGCLILNLSIFLLNSIENTKNTTSTIALGGETRRQKPCKHPVTVEGCQLKESMWQSLGEEGRMAKSQDFPENTCSQETVCLGRMAFEQVRNEGTLWLRSQERSPRALCGGPAMSAPAKAREVQLLNVGTSPRKSGALPLMSIACHHQHWQKWSCPWSGPE